ncbi:MAG TPA: glycosyltransferase family 39 protein [Pyrinomonadaceae bacterium]|nr:glycosyltransferase family 39 protein [Pyrinomonadaceae bacterium]
MEPSSEKVEGGSGAPDFIGGRAALACGLLLALMALQMLFVIREKSITVDEYVMIPAGFYHLTERDYRPVGEHPPVAKILAAAPLLFTETTAPRIDGGPNEYDRFLQKFDEFWRANAGRLEQVSFWARVPAVALTVLLGGLVFVFARRYWGERAALFAAALYSLEPTVLAHGRVVQTDIPSALAFLLFSVAAYEYLKLPDARRAMYVGLALGFAAATKFSMVALAPVACAGVATLFALAPRRGLRRPNVFGQACGLALAAVFAVNAAYLFQRREPDSLDAALARSVIPARVSARLRAPLEVGFSALQTVLPPDFVYGVGWQLGHAQKGHNAGLLGEYSRKGWWYYFPVAFALKTPLPVLLLTLGGLGWAASRLRRTKDSRLLLLLLPPAFFTGLLMLSTINIGVRYYLPAYPFFFAAAGLMLDDLLARARGAGRRRLAASLAAFALCWVAVEAARAFPDHMTYMNQLASGRERWWYLSDSNVEWGDDVRGLALYLRERGETRVGGALLGWQLLGLYGVEQGAVFVPPGGRAEEARYVAVGASLLNGSTVPSYFDDGTELNEDERVNYFEEFRRREPEKIFGGSIYLYRVEEKR